MTKMPVKAREGEELAWSDTHLVRECLAGSEKAWAALVDKYKNLIFSIPIRFRLSSEDAADIFQSVIVDLLSELHRLRQPRALPAWLIQVTSHKCLQLKRQQQRQVSENFEIEALPASEMPESPKDLMRQLQSEQMLRDALFHLSPRCRQLIQMLFFENPPRPYQEVAKSLGIATGSMGFIRRRCLERLRKLLQKAGFQ